MLQAPVALTKREREGVDNDEQIGTFRHSRKMQQNIEPKNKTIVLTFVYVITS